MNTIRPSWAAAAVLALIPILAHDRAAAQVFVVDALTVQTAGNDTSQQRLFQSAGVLSPVDSHIWFIADTLNNGIGTGATYDPGTGTLALGADDEIIYQDPEGVPGQIPAPISGYYQRGGIQYSVQYSDSGIYAVLFNTTLPQSEWNSFAGTSGLRFGIGQVSITPPPPIGNGRWDIAVDVFADQNIITVVPEPAVYGVIASLALAGFVAARKFARRA